MPPEELKKCSGYSVSIWVNGRKAMGILRFGGDGIPVVTTLCFVGPEGECPMISRALSPPEIESLKDLGSCHLDSSITFTADESPLRMTTVDRLITGSDF